MSLTTMARVYDEIDRLRMEAADWRTEATKQRNRADLANSDYADLRRDFEAVGEALARAEAELDELRAVRADYDKVNDRNSCLWIEIAVQAQRIEELEAELGRSEDRRYQR